MKFVANKEEARRVTVRQWVEFTKGVLVGETLIDTLVRSEREAIITKSTQVTWTETRSELLRQLVEGDTK